MSAVSLMVQMLVGAGFLVGGIAKIFGLERLQYGFAALRLGRPVRWGVGVLECLGGVGMLLAVAQPFLTFFAAVLLVALSVTTLLIHAGRRTGKGAWVPALLLAGSTVAAALQPLGLQVLALPKAEALPVDLVSSSRVVKTFDEGVWAESIKVGPDGTLYLTTNQGENYATGDKSRAQAQVIALAPDGTERIFFKLPQGSTAGVIAFGQDGSMYMTGQGERLGVWRLTPDGQGELFAPLPVGAWPNGIAAGPDGQLYVADSLLGVIWRIDPTTGAATRAIESDSLRRRSFIAIAPGANGLRFLGRDLYVTVSDAGRVLRLQLDAAANMGAPSVFAEGIPGDDFAIDDEGSLFITTHPFNTVVRVRQNGERTIVANAESGVTGATDAAFGVLPDDRDTLYVATDGGAFSGDLKARGTLVALKIRTSR